MQNFFALVVLSMEGSVNANLVCEVNVHQQKMRRRLKQTKDVLGLYPKSTIKALNATLQHEWVLYAHAKEQMGAQLSSYSRTTLDQVRSELMKPCFSQQKVIASADVKRAAAVELKSLSFRSKESSRSPEEDVYRA
mmetsp:Transcript_44351/g.87296  ORF Transcript_44351/g.87296 Transcript_44351/m.87296 type:complete len:136 (+) Transcript_44351:1-408(+)